MCIPLLFTLNEMKKLFFDKMIEKSLTGIYLHNTKGPKYCNAFHLFYTSIIRQTLKIRLTSDSHPRSTALLYAHRCNLKDVPIEISAPMNIIPDQILPSHIVVPRCQGDHSYEKSNMNLT